MRMVCVEKRSGHLPLQTWLSVLVAILIAFALTIPQAEAARRKRQKAAPYSPPYASIVHDVNSGRTLHAVHADELRFPASITKVMTLYMLFEQIERGKFQLDSELPVSRHAAAQKPSKLGMRPGSTISVEDAILALVTKSANDIAVVVAEAVGGSEERFAQLMTAKARAIGMSRTTFRNASGLPNPSQVTTARDLVTLGRAIHDRFPKQYSYFARRSFEHETGHYRNHNKLLGRVEGVDGIKTGFTRASGFNLLTSAKVDGRHIITVVLGGRSGRARDAQVAALVEEHMPRAVAGRRAAPRVIEVASAEANDEDDKPTSRNVAPPPPAAQPRLAAASQPAPVAAAPVAAPVAFAAMPVPPARPRAVVIAEPADQGLTRGRPLAIANGGPSPTMQSATTPLALVGTTPRSQALRAIAPPAPVAAAPVQQARGERVVPPANVRFTNTVPTSPPRADEAQPLPKTVEAVTPAKNEARLTAQSLTAPTPLAAAPVVTAPRTAVATQSPAPPKPAPTPAATRTGWIIQLAAADSEAKARTILDSARSKALRNLRSAEAFTEPVNKGSSTLYRARFAGFGADEAQEACKTLKRSGFNCFAQRL
ncbi:DacC D-alanyl-D-alanine carboxypeptidase [Rhabdaerophilaceae bacterium]